MDNQFLIQQPHLIIKLDILGQKYLFHMRLECNNEYEHLRYSRQAHAIVQKKDSQNYGSPLYIYPA